MPFSYANPTSGPSAGGIGWFDFGNFTISPGGSATGLTGVLNNGYTVTFDISLALTSGQPRTFVAVPVPADPGAFFGTVGYTGISGNTALYSNFNFTGPGVNTFIISNIVVLDPGGNPINNYTVILADTETTNTNEAWNWRTNGGGWNLLATLGNNPPTLTGVGTQNVTITGTQLFPEATQASYVMTTQGPTLLTIASTESTSGRQAFSIGFAVTRVTVQKNIGDRIDPADQFVLNIGGVPGTQATTAGNASGIQSQTAVVNATPASTYTISESMAPGSVSALTDYLITVSASNATPAGTVPPTGTLPINFTPALGDDVTYTILNAAPQTFEKTVDKAFANIGDVLTYTVTVDNPNDFAVNNVLVTDATPAGTTYIGNLTVSAPYTGTNPASGITITTIGPDQSVTLTYQVQVNTFPPVPNPVPNFAMVTVPGGTSGMTNVVTTQVNTAFVAINKTVDQPFADLGNTLTYTLTLNNAGNVPADNVNITDAVPTGTTFVPGSLTGATGTLPNVTLLNPIPAGGTATVTFKVLIGDTVPNPNPIPNSASAAYTYTVDPANPDGVNGTAQSNIVSTQVNTADVTVNKAVDKEFANVGAVLSYTITLTNPGNVQAQNVVINDAIPAGTSFIPGSVTGATGIPPQLTLLAPLAPGGTATVSFQVLVGNTVPNPNPIPNTASAGFTYTVNPANPNGVSGNTTGNTVNTQVSTANVTVTKAVDKTFASLNDVLTYTLRLQNTGNTAADSVVITDAVPSGTTFVAGSLTGATGAPPTLVLAAPLQPGGNAVVTYQIKVGTDIPNPNPVPNNALVNYNFTVDPAVPDGASGSNTSNTVNTLISNASVTTVKTVDKAYAKPGDVLTYTLTLQNTGNTTANQVKITEEIPAGTTFVPGSLTGAQGTFPNLTLPNAIPADGFAVISFQVAVNGIPETNPIPNTADATFTFTVNPDNPNGEPGTSTSNPVTTQISFANVPIVKSVDKNTSYPGDIVTYHLSATNTGNAAANNVVITDQLPNGMVFVPGSLTGNVPLTKTPGAISLTDPLAPGATADIFFRAQVTGIPNPNPAINQATANYTYPLDPAEPEVPGTNTSNRVCTLVFRNNYAQQISDIVESVALEEAALAALANAEGAKIQKMAASGDITAQELLCLNQSVADMMTSIALLERTLQQKLGVADCQFNNTCSI